MIELQAGGACYSWRLHLLDGLVVCLRHEARKKIVRCSGEVIVRGIVLTPRESRKATLVERDVKSNKWSGRVKC